MKGKTVAESEVVMLHLPMPDETNPLGNLHGGHLLKYIDNAGGTSAIRHARCHVVTASIDRMDFLTPIRPGELLILKASVNMVGTSTIDVGVRVEVESLTTGVVRHAASCYLTYVAVDKNGRPVEVPPLILSTPAEQRRQCKAEERRLYKEALNDTGCGMPDTPDS